MKSRIKAFIVILGLTLGFGINNAMSRPDEHSCQQLEKVCQQNPDLPVCAVYQATCW